MDPRGFPTTLPEFQQVFPDDKACANYLERVRWPNGFTCPKCLHIGDPYRFPTRSSVVLRCRKCKANTSLTSGTVMQSTHTPLSTWFWAAYLATTQTPGQSALQFQRQLGLSRYETSFQILHKLRACMVRPERDAIGAEHAVEVDECLIGGRTWDHGQGVHNNKTHCRRSRNSRSQGCPATLGQIPSKPQRCRSPEEAHVRRADQAPCGGWPAP